MNQNLYKSPQLFISGEIEKVVGFNVDSVYLKCYIKYGDSNNLISKTIALETLLYKSNFSDKIAINFPFFYHFAVKGIRGWPKLIVEVYNGSDKDFNNNIVGYGCLSFPFSPGNYNINVKTWVPINPDTYNNKELKYKDILLSTGSRYGLLTKSTGTVIFDIDIAVQDFEQHGITF